ncbi:MAG: hypothetical protein QMD92_00160 [bacterium]|nr:hypothetical protein [bacterium]
MINQVLVTGYTAPTESEIVEYTGKIVLLAANRLIDRVSKEEFKTAFTSMMTDFITKHGRKDDI